ncbi:hypothetical protein EG829_09620 [bacterium]|nr:hypothetical protein [bacterium]
MKTSTLTSLAASLALLITATAGAADLPTVSPVQQAALNTLIKGSYAFTASRTCVQTPYAPGFDPETKALVNEGKTVGYIESGTLTFSGTGIVSGKDITVATMEFAVPDPLVPMENRFKSSCTGTYTVSPDRSYSAILACTALRSDGVSLTISPAVYRGSVDLSQNMLTISETGGEIQTVRVALGDYPLQTLERICTSSGTLVRTRK